MSAPSTNWQERIAEDEEVRFAGYAAALVEIQKTRSARFGTGRTLHRKQLLGLDAELTVLPERPQHARFGVFAQERTYPCLVRLSNGGMDKRSDSVPDIRGFAVKILGVDGSAAIGEGRATSQDFLLINHESFSSAGVDPFIAVVKAAARGNAALFGYFLSTYGFIGGLAHIRSALAMMSKPFSGFATERFNTVVQH